MIDTNSHVYPIRVGFRSLSGQTRQLLNFYFDSSGADWFQSASDSKTSDCLLVDVDYPGSREILEEDPDGEHSPILVLSFKPLSRDNTVNLIKPLTLHKLELAAREMAVLVAQGKEPTSVQDAPQLQSVLHAHVSTLSQPEQRNTPSAIDRVISRAMGLDQTTTNPEQTDPVALSTVNPVEQLATFIEGDFLSGYLRRALDHATAEAMAFSITTPDIKLCVLPDEARVYTDISLKNTETTRTIYADLNQEQVSVKFFYEQTKSRVAEEINSRKGFSYALEAFIWRSALYSANGRIPDSYDLTRAARLKYWPNFTRLEKSPHCLEIAALWSQHYLSIQDTIAQSDIPLRHVIAFFNGSYALDLFEYKSDQEDEPADPVSTNSWYQTR
ncbi:MAG: hypothetical protein V3U76_01105 [Granulosicoccus sp.]